MTIIFDAPFRRQFKRRVRHRVSREDREMELGLTVSRISSGIGALRESESEISPKQAGLIQII
jgi:hypothetical protein